MTDWPPLDFAAGENTYDTLHMWTQIVGKTRMVLTPLENHWWNVPLYVTPCGLSTSPIPFRHAHTLQHESFEVEFDFIAHELSIRTSKCDEAGFRLCPRSVADFYKEYMARLRLLGVDVSIDPKPVEFDDTTRFDQDERHAAYDTQVVENLRRVLTGADRAFKAFRSRFIGKCSPVHFFWGSFDLAVSRFSGRTAPVAPNADPITREGYSHEVISCGFWPGDRRFPQAAFYSYTAPAPSGLKDETVRPAGAAYWDPQLSEFILKYEDARASESPEQAILEFCQSTYEAGAKLAKWDRDALERRP
jgi:Family of unknown function (DUF5996)